MDESIKTLLVKFISGNADESEKRAVRNWLSESSDNQEYFNSLKTGWDNGLHYPARPIVDTNAAFNKMKDRLGVADAAIPIRRSWRGGLKAAVIVGLIVLIGGGIGIGLMIGGRKNSQPALAAANHEVSVPFGKMKRLLLPDSTEVWLNAGTTLNYGAGYGEHDREVTLEGEGYFAVRHDPRLPFIVHAQGYTVRDIGTVFTISAYRNNRNFRTAVMEGEVEVTGKPGKVKLGKNEVYQIEELANPDKRKKAEKATISAPLQPVITKLADMESYSGWKDHLLVFNEETFDEVAQRLERTFDVKIRITSEKLAAIRYTGRFNRVQNIRDALTIIKETTPIVYRVNKDTIISSPDKK